MKSSKFFTDAAAYEVGDKTIAIDNSMKNGVHGVAVIIKEIIAVSDSNIEGLNDSRQKLFGDRYPPVEFGDTVYVCQLKYRDQIYPYKSTELISANVMADLAAGVKMKEPKLPAKKHSRHTEAAHTPT